MKLFIHFAFSIIILTQLSFANATNATPYECVKQHIDNLQKDNYFPEEAAKSFNKDNYDEASRIEFAIKLKQVLDGKGLYIHTNKIPRKENYIDSLNYEANYTLSELEPRIFLEKEGESWYYSESTIQDIDKMYQEVYPFGTRLFSKILPSKIGNKLFLGFFVWQYLGLVLIIFGALLFYTIVKHLVRLFLNYIIYKREIVSIENQEFLQKISKSFSLVMVFFSLSKIVPSLQLEANILQYLVKGIDIFIIFLVAILAMRIGTYALSFFKIYVNKTDSKLDDQLLPIVQKMLRILIALIAISLALKQLDVNLTAIIAGLSIGGLALALASQDTVKNFIGSITIFLDHPFEIGDYIVIAETEGTVEEVGMRATRIRTPNQSLAYVPNGQLSNMVIDNIGLRIFRRWELIIGLEYASSIEQIESFCIKAKEMLDRDFSELAPEKSSVQLSELASSSINIFLNLFLNVKTYDEELQSKHRILLALMKLAKEEGLEFAYPSQTLYLKRP